MRNGHEINKINTAVHDLWRSGESQIGMESGGFFENLPGFFDEKPNFREISEPKHAC